MAVRRLACALKALRSLRDANIVELQNASRVLAAHAADQLAVLTARIDAIERAQRRLSGALAALRNLYEGESCMPVPDAAVAGRL